MVSRGRLLLICVALLAFIADKSSAQIGYTCFVNAVCKECEFLTYSMEVDANNCLFACQEQKDPFGPQCEWFTYHPTGGHCLMFSKVGYLDAQSDDCDDCLSGENECDPVYECDLDGVQCQAAYVNDDSLTAISSDDCLLHCQNNPECTWYTFNSFDNGCVLFADCMSRVDCDTCTSGEVTCSPAPTDTYDKLFIVGGNDSNADLVDVVDLSEDQASCSAPPPMPIKLKGPSGVFLGGKVIVCGGLLPDETPSSDCYSYNSTENAWSLESFSLLTARAHAASIKINETTWWITGGGSSGSFFKSTELFNVETQEFTYGPDLDRALTYHCITQTDFHKFMVTGGANLNNLRTSAEYDFVSKQWTSLAPLMRDRYGHVCGKRTSIVNDTWKQEVIISAGNARETDVYDMATNSWSIGAVFPYRASYGASVAYGNTFLTVGGSMNELGIYQYGEDEEDTSPIYIRLNATMSYPRAYIDAFLVPDTFYPC